MFDALKCSNVAIRDFLDVGIVRGRFCRALSYNHQWDIAVSSSSCVLVDVAWFQKDFGAAISDFWGAVELYRIARGPGPCDKA